MRNVSRALARPLRRKHTSDSVARLISPSRFFCRNSNPRLRSEPDGGMVTYKARPLHVDVPVVQKMRLPAGRNHRGCVVLQESQRFLVEFLDLLVQWRVRARVKNQ